MHEICAIILAAGESKRMGFPKMLLTFNGRTMIENVIGNVSASVIEKIIVVLGAYKEELIEIVKNTGVHHCINENYKQGMLSSVICGLKNLPAGTKAVTVFQGDQPFISPSATNLVVEAYLSSGKGIIIPVYQNKRGHPLLFDARYTDEIQDLDHDKGLRSLLDKHPDDILEVVTNVPGILRDFDTYEEYKMEINKLE